MTVAERERAYKLFPLSNDQILFSTLLEYEIKKRDDIVFQDKKNTTGGLESNHPISSSSTLYAPYGITSYFKSKKNVAVRKMFNLNADLIYNC